MEKRSTDIKRLPQKYIMATWKYFSWSHLVNNMYDPMCERNGSLMNQWMWVINYDATKVKAVDKNSPLIIFVGQHGVSYLGHKRPKMLVGLTLIWGSVSCFPLGLLYLYKLFLRSLLKVSSEVWWWVWWKCRLIWCYYLAKDTKRTENGVFWGGGGGATAPFFSTAGALVLVVVVITVLGVSPTPSIHPLPLFAEQ